MKGLIKQMTRKGLVKVEDDVDFGYHHWYTKFDFNFSVLMYSNKNKCKNRKKCLSVYKQSQRNRTMYEICIIEHGDIFRFTLSQMNTILKMIHKCNTKEELLTLIKYIENL